MWGVMREKGSGDWEIGLADMRTLNLPISRSPITSKNTD